jgi:hypothetical protein
MPALPAPTTLVAAAPAASPPDIPVAAATLSTPPAVMPPPKTPEPEKVSLSAQPDTQRFSAPGLLLVARPHDTLETLYERVYRGVRPPPFAEVAALNPAHFRAGDTLIFPVPSNGWPNGRGSGQN